MGMRPESERRGLPLSNGLPRSRRADDLPRRRSVPGVHEHPAGFAGAMGATPSRLCAIAGPMARPGGPTQRWRPFEMDRMDHFGARDAQSRFDNARIEPRHLRAPLPFVSRSRQRAHPRCDAVYRIASMEARHYLGSDSIPLHLAAPKVFGGFEDIELDLAPARSFACLLGKPASRRIRQRETGGNPKVHQTRRTLRRSRLGRTDGKAIPIGIDAPPSRSPSQANRLAT